MLPNISKGNESWEEYALRLEKVIAELQSYIRGLLQGIESRENKPLIFFDEGKVKNEQ